MKLKTTKSQIKNNFNTILSINYCGCQNLTYFKNPFAYSCGVYGWSCDYYQIDNICISTGYSPIGQNVDYQLLRKYELKAEKVIRDYNTDYQKRAKKVEKLLNEFIQKCITKN